jgi:hypothetical protein
LAQPLQGSKEKELIYQRGSGELQRAGQQRTEAGCPAVQDPVEIFPPAIATGVHPSQTVPGVWDLVSVSGGAVVLVDEFAEHIDPLDRARARRDLVGRYGDLETRIGVGGSGVVVDVGRQDPLKMTTVQIRAQFKQIPRGQQWS